MRIVLLIATRRGYLFLKKMLELLPNSDLIVFSFKEESWEPPFINDIHELTLSHEGQFFEAKQVGNDQFSLFWKSKPIDLMIAVSWRYIIPTHIFNIARIGTFVFHDSLLPEYRGFSPTVWSIINGEDHTGVTLFRISEQVDCGDIIDQERIPIHPDDMIADVMDRVTQAYLHLLERNFDKLANSKVTQHPQNSSLATYTCKRIPEDNLIDWSLSTDSIYNLIRAVSAPYPGAYTSLFGEKLIIWSAQILQDPRKYVGSVPGRVVEIRPGEGTIVLTGNGSLLITRVQIHGEGISCACDVLNSINMTLGR